MSFSTEGYWKTLQANPSMLSLRDNSIVKNCPQKYRRDSESRERSKTLSREKSLSNLTDRLKKKMTMSTNRSSEKNHNFTSFKT